MLNMQLITAQTIQKILLKIKNEAILNNVITDKMTSIPAKKKAAKILNDNEKLKRLDAIKQGY